MPSLVLVKHDAQGRVERSRQPVLRHPGGGERIADLVLQRFSRKAGGAQQPAVVSGTKDRQFRTALQRLVRPHNVAPPQCLGDGGIKHRRQRFERRLDLGKRLRGFDSDMLDLDWDGGTVGHGSSYSLVSECAALIAAHTFCGVSGMSRWATPNGANASSTAWTIVGGAPIAPLSPIPLTPSGFTGDGVCWNCERIA